MAFTYSGEIYLPGYRPNVLAPDPELIQRVARLINEAQRPLILAGQGVSMARAETELRLLAEKANIPVATSLLGIGTFPSTHPLSISWGGMHGEAYCRRSAISAALGARRVTTFSSGHVIEYQLVQSCFLLMNGDNDIGG